MKIAAITIALAGSAAIGSGAHAGGVSRPFNGSAASSGMAGAFGAIADDPSCLTANPAGCGFAAPGALVSLDVVYAPRSYVPIDAEGTRGDAQDAAAVAPAPTLGFLFRPGPDSKVMLGLGAWNSFGGTLHWPKPEVPLANGSLDASTELVFEVGVGAGWAIDEHVSVGALVRIGFGFFGISATSMPVDADLSATGIGVGAGLGILVRPTEALSFGLAWKSDLDVKTTGSGTVDIPPVTNVDIEHVQHWPQSFTLATAYKVGDALVLAAQLDWVQWSRFESLDIHAPGNESLDTQLHFDLDWSDSITARLGASYRMSESLTLRGGVLYDSNAVPDRTIARQYLDGPKAGVSAGAGIRLSKKIVLDLTADGVAGTTRTIADNSMDVPSQWPEQINDAPGEHSGQVFTFSTGVRILL
jgi:long-chain fatty acid transport protein